jgi:putative two-component system response regulator
MDQLVLQEMRILVVDDNAITTLAMKRMLAAAGYSNVESTGNPTLVPGLCASHPPDLILLDLHMPELTGFQVMAALAKVPSSGPSPPIVVVTSDDSADARRRALSYGAIDIVTQPFDRAELELRVRNHLHARRLAVELEALAGDREQRARRAENELDSARMDILERLAHAAEFTNPESVLHTWRVGRLSGQIAAGMAMARDECEPLAFAARLHDVGKVAIPDQVLFKPARLSAAEWNVVRRHPEAGAEILGGSSSALVQLAATIARSHHERWDGGGYPDALRGASIPVPARIVALADVFDAVTHERAYDTAWTHERARAHIADERGRHFDPQVVDAFLALDPGTLAGSAEDLSLGAPA